MSETLLSMTEAARALKCSTNTVRRLCDAGVLQCEVTPLGRLVSADGVTAEAERRGVPAESDLPARSDAALGRLQIAVSSLLEKHGLAPSRYDEIVTGDPAMEEVAAIRMVAQDLERLEVMLGAARADAGKAGA